MLRSKSRPLLCLRRRNGLNLLPRLPVLLRSVTQVPMSTATTKAVLQEIKMVGNGTSGTGITVLGTVYLDIPWLKFELVLLHWPLKLPRTIRSVTTRARGIAMAKSWLKSVTIPVKLQRLSNQTALRELSITPKLLVIFLALKNSRRSKLRIPVTCVKDSKMPGSSSLLSQDI